MCGGASLVPRLSPRTTMTNSKEEGESLAWYPFARDATERMLFRVGKGISFNLPWLCITQPRPIPIPKFYTFLMGWDQGWVMAFPLVSSLFEGWSMIGHP